MQTFGQTNNNSNNTQGKTTTIGQHTIKIVRAAKLSLETHPVRFYPLSPEFYQGADYPYIVQSFHWFNRQPILCRCTSYDYTVPDTQQKPFIDSQCPICKEKFLLYAKAKELGYDKKKGYRGSPPASVELHKAANQLNARIACTSLVSFVENGMLAFPVILTYGKELMDAIEFHAKRIEDNTGIGICDPKRGYMFEIIIRTKSNSDQRDYTDSLPSINNNSVDITGNAWKWEELCYAVKSEIVSIPSSDQVIEFYNTNCSKNSIQQYTHPMLQNNQNIAVPTNSKLGLLSGNQYINPTNPIVNDEQSVNNGQIVNPVAEVNTKPIIKPDNNGQVVNSESGGVKVGANPNNSQVLNSNVIPTFTPPVVTTEVFPCHASISSGLGYDEQDSNCKGCVHTQTCFDAKNKKIIASAPIVNNQPVKRGQVVNTGNVNNLVANNNDNVADDVQKKLNVLNNEMQ